MELDCTEDEVLGVLTSLRKKPQKVMHLFGPHGAKVLAEYLRPVEKIEQLRGAMAAFLEDRSNGRDIEAQSLVLSEKLLDWACAQVEAKKLGKATKQVRALENRARYLPEVVLSRQAVTNRDGLWVKDHWHGDTDLKSAGLLRSAVAHIYGVEAEPPVFAVVNNLPVNNQFDSEDNVDSQQREIEPNYWEALEEQGILVSGERVCWTKSSKAYQWLCKLFPAAIDCRAYNHSLNAPLLPGGFIPGCKVKLTTIKTTDGVSAQTDGCGRIHPKHELFEKLARPGGPCVVQIRAINEKGLFLKGILVPDERCVGPLGEPEIWCDLKQVKGRYKKQAAKHIAAAREESVELFLGVLQAWDRPRELKFSFQQLQLFETRPETVSIVKQWVDAAYEEELGQGIDGLLAGIASDNPQLRLTLELVAAINEKEEKFSAAQIPTVQGALQERLQKTLYFLAQGAGKKTQQVVAVLDAGIPEGEVVCAGYKPGESVVVYRYPTLLPQGVMGLKARAPLPHHLMGKKVVPHAIFMNPRDLVHKAQGDSDGDIMGITNDPLVIELMKYRIGDNSVYMVEPEGVKIDTLTNTREGERYMRGDPRGNVGGMCLHQARMFAIGNLPAAIAMAFPYQEAVDQAKNKIAWTDFRLAEHLEDWTPHPKHEGRLVFTTKLPEEEYEEGELPEKLIRKWVRGKLKSAGVDWTLQNVLGWRHEGKHINPKKWTKCVERGLWEGGNLVHVCHDYALEKWSEYASKFHLDLPLVDVSELLAMALKNSGIEFTPAAPIGWVDYERTLRADSGIRTYAQRMAKIMSQPENEEFRQQMIDTTSLELDAKLSTLSVQELEVIWRMESTTVYRLKYDEKRFVYTTEAPAGVPEERLKKMRANNPNYAFRAVAFPGSAVLKLLGVETEKECSFLHEEIVWGEEKTRGTRLEMVIGLVTQSPNPHQKLVELIWNSKSHGQYVKDENGNAIHGKDCTSCTTKLENALVYYARAQKTGVEYDFIRTLCKNLNHS
jgi:hypothetical protein